MEKLSDQKPIQLRDESENNQLISPLIAIVNMKNHIKLNGNFIVNPYLANFNIAQTNLNLAIAEQPSLTKRFRPKLSEKIKLRKQAF